MRSPKMIMESIGSVSRFRGSGAATSWLAIGATILGLNTLAPLQGQVAAPSPARPVAAESPVRQSQPAAVTYNVRFPEAEHHWLEVAVTFPGLGTAPLRARMSRSSPGRYAVHEFAKNVFQISARDGAERPLAVSRSGADQWLVAGHDGSVTLTYRIFGDFADGTYMAVDTTHAHLNMPATFMWAEGLELRPIEIAFIPPSGSGWTAGTQLFATADPLVFTAPNLQYFMDSPVELARLVTSTFTVPQPGSAPAQIRIMAHTTASQGDLDAFAALVQRVVVAQTAIFGELPRFDNGYYTFLIDTVSWASPDAMEHRNSTYITLPGVPLATAAGRAYALEAVSHEFFHVWNTERIRPQGLEPFDFTRQNVTCCLWLAEGFTEYYASLALVRAGMLRHPPFRDLITVATSTARQVRSAVEMSEHAPFTDAAVANDVDDSHRSFLSYYAHGSAIAIGLDLSLRERSGGRITLDDYMRRLWRDFGASLPSLPGYVARPYSLADLRITLAAVSGDRAFADAFFDRYIEGHDIVDYRALLALAGYSVQAAAPGRGWVGAVALAEEAGGLRVGLSRSGGTPQVVPFDTPAYRAGIDAGDLIVSLDDQPATLIRWTGLSTRPPGTAVRLVVERRDGRRVTTTMTLGVDPSLHVMPNEDLGVAVTDAQKAFRAAWLGGITS
jgi:predicted metalloprotease with PDZ domain